MEQSDLFDLPRGRKARDAGVLLVTEHNPNFVADMRAYAVEHARRYGTVHIDDVRQHAISNGFEPKHQNAWGAIFRASLFRKTGEYRASRLVSNHGHRSPVWALAELVDSNEPTA